MKKYLILCLTSTLILVAHTFPKQLSLDGKWLYHIQNLPQPTHYTYVFNGDEPSIELPNNWYRAGINHAGTIWFERTFKREDIPNIAHHFLEFTGVDYLCEIWVNNHYVGSHTGYFQTFSFDISAYLQQGENTIKVKVNSPLENYPEHYSLHKTLLRGIFSHHDTRPGGAWSAEGQDKNSGGIWNHIAIKSYNHYKINHLRVTPNIHGENASLKIDLNISRLFFSTNTSFLYASKMTQKPHTIHASLTPYNFVGKSYSESYDVKHIGNQKLIMALEHPKLWSTHDRGFPYLYTLTLTLGDTSKRIQVGIKSLTQDIHKVYALNGVPSRLFHSISKNMIQYPHERL